MSVRIEPYPSADELDARDLTRVVEIFNDTWAEWVPGERPISAPAYCDEDRLTHSPEVVLRRLARDDRGDVVGTGIVEFRESEPGACVAKIFVAPATRRHGVGTELGAALADAARAAGRVGVTLEAREGSEGVALCERAGLKPDMVVEMNRARADAASDELLTSWITAGEATEGYSLVNYDGACPDDDLAAAFVEARHVMNDAPRWEGEPPSTFTLAELRALEHAVAAANTEWWSLGVRHDASSAIVGLSELFLVRARPWMAFQGDTGVDPAHRGHGLGAWMKAVNHLRLRAERPDVQTVQTWNASANAPMLRINRALGFRPAATFQGWFLPFG